MQADRLPEQRQQLLAQVALAHKRGHRRREKRDAHGILDSEAKDRRPAKARLRHLVHLVDAMVDERLE